MGIILCYIILGLLFPKKSIDFTTKYKNYLDYALESDAIYVHFGWSPYAQSDIKSLGINNLNGLYNPSNMFWRDKQYSAPQTVWITSHTVDTALLITSYIL